MAEETLSIENLAELPIEELSEEKPPTSTEEETTEERTEETTEEATEASPEEDSTFLDSIHKAMEPEAKEELEPEETPPEEENLSPSAKNFKKIKDDRDNARRELEKLKKEVGNKNEGEDDGSGKIARLESERDELSKELKLVSIERHPEFRRKFEERASKLVAAAKSMVGVGLDEKIVQILFMEEGDKKTEELDDIFSELPVSKQARLANIIQDMDNIQEERVEALNEANATYANLQESDRQNRAGFMHSNQQLFDEVSERAQSLEFFKLKDDDDEWNKGVQDRLDLARNIYTGSTSSEELVLASLWAAQAPIAREALAAQVEVNRRLRAQLKEMQGATPSVTADAPAGEAGEKKGFLDTLHGLMEER